MSSRMLRSNGIIAVTTGEAWADIDAYASLVAYTEALNLTGMRAVAVNPGAFNATVPESYRRLGYAEKVAPEGITDVVMVDISNPEFFARFVDINNVKEIFDHHQGFETFWKDRLGDHAHIEMIGAAATLVWETIRAEGLTQKLRPETAKLVAAAITSNTLNFHIDITSDRDRRAFAEAAALSDFDDAAREQYYVDCEQILEHNLGDALINDTKYERIPHIPTPVTIGQIEMWHSESFIQKHTKIIQKTLEQHSKFWFLNAPSLQDEYTVLYCTNPEIQGTLTHVLDVVWTDNIGKVPRLILRKEILKALRR